jgi:hypothetical protein
MRSPATFYGQEILVEGYVDEVYGPSAFTIDNRTQRYGYDDLLVIVPRGVAVEPASAPLDEGEDVQVYGELRKLTTVDLDDLAEVDEDIDVDYDSEPVLILQAIGEGG